MNDDLLRALMTDLDPVRDLTDESLSELLPLDQLIARVLLEADQPIPVHRSARVPAWRRVSVRLTSAAAAIAIVVTGAVTLLSSTPVPQSTPLFGPQAAASWSRFTAPPLQKYGLNQQIYAPGFTSTAAPVFTKATGDVVTFGDLVSKGRFIGTFAPNGITIEPAPSSIKTTVPASQMAKTAWATAQLSGYHATVFGFAQVSTSIHNATVSQVHQVPAWAAIAFKNVAHSCPGGVTVRENLCTSVDYSQIAIVVIAYNPRPLNTGIYFAPTAFVYKLSGTGHPQLAPAIEQVAVPWIQDGPVRNGQLHITVSPVSCGTVDGYSLSSSGHTTVLTVRALIPDRLLGSFCVVAGAKQKGIPLTSSNNGVVKWLVSPTTKFVHSTTGALNATN